MEQLQSYDHYRCLHASGLLMDEADVCAKEQVFYRLSRILNWTPETEDLPDDRYFARRNEAEICQLLRLFEEWLPIALDREANVNVQFVAYGIAKLCYWYWVDDSDIVRQVLDSIYKCDKSFSGIFTRVIDESDRRFLMWFLSKNSTPEKEFSFMVYFLHHANKSRLMHEGVRFLDVELVHPIQVPPAMAAAIYVKPKALILFLRYGAIVCYNDPKGNSSLTNRQIQRDWDVSLVLKHLLRILWSCLGYQMVFSPNAKNIVSNTMQNVCLCLRMLLRAIPQVDAEGLRFSLMTIESGQMTKFVTSESFIRWLSNQGFVPKLSTRCYQPSSLQHLCRCEIRILLNNNWCLPHGIYTLDIPKILQKYLDLFED